MDESLHKVRADFDRIALLSSDSVHNDSYLDYLLRHAPDDCGEALEIGCGTGAFSRLLATRAQQVLALDLSPNMIQLARQRARDYPNIDFQCADATVWDFPVERFDCIASVATLHHLEMRAMLSKMKRALKKGGTLLILDLFENDGAVDALTSLLAMPVSMSLRLLQTGRLRAPRAVREAWDEHGRTDSYLTLTQVRNICGEMLPGAKVRKHLLWRYSIIWTKHSSLTN
jgi:ubiquinone/menaquinone biosynthesis C-methylase UbiE